MYKKICLVLTLCALAASLTIRHTDAAGLPLLGGWTAIDTKDLSPQQEAVNNFIQSEERGLQKATLVKAEQQTVAGTNYKFTYQTEKGNEEVLVHVSLSGEKTIKGVKPVSLGEKAE